MDIRPIQFEPSKQITRPANGPVSAPRSLYPLRVLARIFSVFGIATTVYAVALVAAAVQSSIIEF